MIAKKLVRIEHEHGNRLLPKVFLETKVFEDMCTPWKDALVIKLLGKTLGYNTLKDRLKKVWKLQGGFEIMDNDNGFYMVKFDQVADREKVISDGPWMIFDHCLAVSHWSPGFASPEAKVKRTIIWIRFPGLNLVYYDESFLLAMASAISRPIKVDNNTLKMECGRFARVCVEVDLTLSVVGKIWLNGHWYKVQYEGLHIICTTCGCYGHLYRDCTEKKNEVTMSNGSGTQQVESIPKSDSSNHAQNHMQTRNVSENQVIDPPSNTLTDEENNLHGEWLTVTRRKKQVFNGIKNIISLSNPFETLSNLTQTHKDKKYIHYPLPPRPRAHEVERPNKSSADLKHRRTQQVHDDQVMKPQQQVLSLEKLSMPQPIASLGNTHNTNLQNDNSTLATFKHAQNKIMSTTSSPRLGNPSPHNYHPLNLSHQAIPSTHQEENLASIKYVPPDDHHKHQKPYDLDVLEEDGPSHVVDQNEIKSIDDKRSPQNMAVTGISSAMETT